VVCGDFIAARISSVGAVSAYNAPVINVTNKVQNRAIGIRNTIREKGDTLNANTVIPSEVENGAAGEAAT
jgi:hypothetical protein